MHPMADIRQTLTAGDKSAFCFFHHQLAQSPIRSSPFLTAEQELAPLLRPELFPTNTMLFCVYAWSRYKHHGQIFLRWRHFHCSLPGHLQSGVNSLSATAIFLAAEKNSQLLQTALKFGGTIPLGIQHKSFVLAANIRAAVFRKVRSLPPYGVDTEAVWVQGLSALA